MKYLISAVMYSMCGASLAGTSPDLVRASDKLHLDIRELIQTETNEVEVYARVDLCALGSTAKDAVCSPLTSVGPAKVAGRGEAPSITVKYPDGKQSDRVLGATINAKGQQLSAGLNGSVTYRLVLTVQKNTSDGKKILATRQYSKLPPLDQEGPVAERGAIIDRHTFEAPDKSLRGRVLVVLTRRNP